MSRVGGDLVLKPLVQQVTFLQQNVDLVCNKYSIGEEQSKKYSRDY